MGGLGVLFLLGAFGVGAVAGGCDANDPEPPRTTAVDAGASDAGQRGANPDADPSLAPIPTVESTDCPPIGDPPPFRLEFVPANVEIAAGGTAPVEVKIVRRSGFRTLVSLGADDPSGLRFSFNAADGHTAGMSGLVDGATFDVIAEAGRTPGEVVAPFDSFTPCAHFRAGELRITVR